MQQSLFSDPPPAGSRFGRSFDRHVGKSVAWLDEALVEQPELDTAGSFVSRREAEDALEAVLAQNRAEIAAWLAGGATSLLALHGTFSGGVVRLPGGFTVTGTGVSVVLRGNGDGGFYVRTGHPVA
jgi:hypothetical protein